VIKSEFSKNVSKLASGTTIAQALPFVISPILTRLYTPEDFAIFGLYFSIVSITGTISTGRYELAILLPRSADLSKIIVHLGLYIGFLIAFISLIICYFFPTSIINLLNESKVRQWLVLIPFSILFQSIYLNLNYYNNRRKKFGKITNAKISKSILLNATSLFIGYKFNNTNGLIIGFLFGQIIELALLFDRSIFMLSKQTSARYNDLIKGLAQRYINFPKYSAASALLNAASLQLPIILLSRFYTSVSTGAYFQAHRVINAPISIIGTAIGQVYFQKATEMKRDLHELGNFTFNLYKKLFLLAGLPIALILAFGQELFGFVFGEEWVIAGKFAQMISVWILFVFISTPFSTLLSVLEKQKVSMLLNLVMFISRFLAIGIGYWAFNSVEISILIFGITGAVIWCFFSVYLLHLVKVRFSKVIRFLLIGFVFIILPFIIKYLV